MRAYYNENLPDYPIRISNESGAVLSILTIPEAEQFLEQLTTAIGNAKEGVQRSSS